jgi:hypothetical protein
MLLPRLGGVCGEGKVVSLILISAKRIESRKGMHCRRQAFLPPCWFQVVEGHIQNGSYSPYALNSLVSQPAWLTALLSLQPARPQQDQQFVEASAEKPKKPKGTSRKKRKASEYACPHFCFGY